MLWKTHNNENEGLKTALRTILRDRQGGNDRVWVPGSVIQSEMVTWVPGSEVRENKEYDGLTRIAMFYGDGQERCVCRESCRRRRLEY